MTLDLRAAHEVEGRDIMETCEAVEVSRATLFRWRTPGGAAAAAPGPKGLDPDIVATMIDEIRELRHRKRRTYGTEAIFLAYSRLVPYSVIEEAIRLERMDRNRLEKMSAKRYEFSAPQVAWSTDFIKVVGGRVMRLDDDCSRLSLACAHQENWPDDDVARFIDDGFTRYGAPLIFKFDRGVEFANVVVQTLLCARLVIPLPSPPRYPKANGKQERKNRSVRSWLLPIAADSLDVTETFDEISTALIDLNDRPMEILRGLSPREAYARWPRETVDRAALFQEWDALRQKLLTERFGGRKIEVRQELEAMRIAALTVLRKHKLVWYGSRPEVPGV